MSVGAAVHDEPAASAPTREAGPAVPGPGAATTLWDAHGEKLRYLVVGVYNTIVSYGAFVAAITFVSPVLESAAGISHKAAALVIQWVVWVLAVVHSTLTMKYWVFRSRGHLGTEVAKSYMVYLPSQGLSSVILWFFMAVLGLSAIIGQAVAIMTAAVTTFIGHKYFTFRGDGA